jgi:hypothetical protein
MKGCLFPIQLFINIVFFCPCNETAAGSLMKCGLLTELLEVTWALSPGAMRVDWQFILCSAETV